MESKKQQIQINVGFSRVLSALLCCLLLGCNSSTQKEIYESELVQLLFLGHNSEHHHSEKYMPMLASALVDKGIQFTYTTNTGDINPENLAKYDGLVIYANIDSISGEQEAALLDFVKEGKGLIPIHCASYCFRNSEAYVDLVGGQFKEHGTATFTAGITPLGKELLGSISPFETWDETYVHDKINPSIQVLMERVEGTHTEPWTWVNTYGKGRVFYTAYGHDERTWSNPGFHELMEKGIFWAVGEKVAAEAQQLAFPSPKYTPAKIPNYEKRDPPLKLQSALSAEESMQLTQVPLGFSLELFAAEPDIVNPIAMAWDERGRLWVVETVDYPNTVRNDTGKGDDRITICEDTDQDGKADKFTVFADQLNIPTSIVFANGGVIVAQAPDFLFLKDTNGDDKADVRKTIMTGWGTFDTHAGPSNLKYGFDNKVWGTVGYSGYKGQVGGRETKFGQGIFRFDTDGSGLVQLSKTSNNTWGLGFSENFDVFASTANNTHSVYMGIPNQYLRGIQELPSNGSQKIDGHYAMHPITNQVRQVDVFGGFTAAAGHNLYTARSYPPDYWNRAALVCEPTGRLIHHAILEKQGAGFVEKDGWNLTASNDNWFGPVHAEVGPDGAVWFADWYNFIIQHNPTPPGFENGKGNAHINPLRDRKHGRIYRLVYKGAKPHAPLQLTPNDPEKLLKTLGHDNLLWRLHAQRLLVERGKSDVEADLWELVASREQDALGISPQAIHALWTLHGLGKIAPSADQSVQDALAQGLKHPSAGVRKAAAQVLPPTEWGAVTLAQSGVMADEDKHTQLAALLVAADMPASRAVAEHLLALAQQDEVLSDEWLAKAVYIAAVRHKKDFLSVIRNQKSELIDQWKSKSDPGNPWDPVLDDSDWKKTTVPGFWKATAIGDIDGEVWFRKEVRLGSSPGRAKLSLGPIDDSDETWVNGKKVGGMTQAYDKPRVYNLPDGLLKKGKNSIAVKVTDTGGGGGMYGKPADVWLQQGSEKISLAGDWKFEIAKVAGGVGKSVFSKEKTILSLFLENHLKQTADEAEVADKARTVNQRVVIKPIVNEMKFDLKEFEVTAGDYVEVRFSNIDFMQHNLLILSPGSLEKVGQAADKMATHPDGAALHYTPDMAEVLYATKLVDPDAEAVLRFEVPDKPGDYPFVCTFPGHWRIMNGIMKVKPKK